MTSALQPGTPPADPTRTPTPDRDARGLPTTVTQTDPESSIPRHRVGTRIRLRCAWPERPDCCTW